MRRCLALAAVVIPLFAGVSALPGAERRFPYDGTVIDDDVEVRCGPGTRFPATGTVSKSQQVTVHRHDHGGWYMISPPPGSFSWISASQVQKNGDQGTVQFDLASSPTARAIVYIGGEKTEELSYYGRELSNGDTVRILGEKVLKTPQGEDLMYKIDPPRQEYRWIKGENIVPVSPERQQQLAEDPYQIPVKHRQRLARLDLEPIQGVVPDTETAVASDPSPPALAGPQFAESAPVAAPSLTTASATPNKDDRAALQRIDERYAAMMSREPAQWDLASVEREYQALAREAAPAVASMIPARLAAIDKRKRIADHYHRFVQLSHETSQRDAELAAQQAGYQVTADLAAAPSGSAMTLAPQPEPVPQYASRPTDQQAGGLSAAPVTPRLNGAGVIRPLQQFPGQPAFGLFAPEGRLLALLEFAPGVDFQSWIGREAGLIGQRSFNPRTGTDFIRVQRIVPVQLAP